MMRLDQSMFWFAHYRYSWLFLILVLTASVNVSAEIIHHELQVKLYPQQSRMSVIDDMQLPAETDSADFTLRSSFTVVAPGVELIVRGQSADGRLRHYQINRLPADGKVQLLYEGNILSDSVQGPFGMPDSVLDGDTVYLGGGSYWVPRIEDFPRCRFRMIVSAPLDWEIISQGMRSVQDDAVIFDMAHPQEEIYLVGGPYKRFAQTHDSVELEVYLYEGDTELATSYLQASANYISLYSDWIGAYPYTRFAVVENRWQTGYGMPSFTLLGSRVIRLPFIPDTSLPHEILHNWWGNGVYIDFSKGNWSEGLTAYMSDHYSNEQQGKDAEYRRKALERYVNFAAEGRDFALADFSSRHDEASQAVGYSKSLMLFHMLRRFGGDELFNQGIRHFWQQYQFRPADFPDVIKALFPGADAEYKAYIEQWLYRTGAPEIALGEVTVSKINNDYVLSVEIRQQQKGPAYTLRIPLEVSLEGNQQPVREQVDLSAKRKVHTYRYNQRPRAIRLDPEYDVFRLLNPLERPASLGRLFGAKQQVLVMPQGASKDQRKAWRELAAAWTGLYKNVRLVDSNDMNGLPEDAAVWLLGWQNELLERFQQRLTSSTQQLSARAVTINNQRLAADRHTVVLLDPDNSRAPLAFIGADDPVAILMMARKLPHYSSYGVLAFDTHQQENIIKQHLPVLNSPLAKQLAP
ncbi:MAG: M1 family aminopeptidase [Gammaproteobacteria bacterium]